jgi:hypothetical protein
LCYVSVSRREMPVIDRPLVNEKLHKAMRMAAQSLVALRDFQDGLIAAAEEISAARRGGRPPSEDEDPWEPDAIPEEQRDELERRQGAHEALMEQIASDPGLRAEMRCWMVDFHGNEEPPGVRNGNVGTMTPEQMQRATHADFGVLPRLVRSWVTDRGFTITDSESGAQGWMLGIPCTDEESVRLCRLAHDELGPHITAGALRVHIHFFGWSFRQIPTRDDAIRFLKTTSLS